MCCTSKLSCGECDRSEQCTGIVVICCSVALLVGYAVIGCMNKKLSRTFHSDNREYTKGNQKPRTVGVKDKLLAKSVTNTVRQICVICSTARTGAISIRDLCAENDGINRFNNSNGIVCSGLHIAYTAIISGSTGSKGDCSTLTTV